MIDLDWGEEFGFEVGFLAVKTFFTIFFDQVYSNNNTSSGILPRGVFRTLSNILDEAFCQYS